MKGLLLFLGAFFAMSTAHAGPLNWNDFSHTVGISITKQGGSTTCSGILVAPKVVLTAAHCIEGLKEAWVTTGRKITDRPRVRSVDTRTHPGYRGNLPGGSVDLGLIFLARPLLERLVPTPVMEVQEALTFERIGFGGRDGQNVRTWIVSFYDGRFGDYVRARDELGVLGDSGGPVFQRGPTGLGLVGVHTGREIGPSGALTNVSFIQPLAAKEWAWVTETLRTTRPPQS